MIYILKFESPLGNDKHRAQYYLGYCQPDRLGKRLAEHAKGQGAAITKALAQRGIGFSLVLTMPGDRNLERRLKNWKSHSKVIESYRNRPEVTLH